MEYLSNAVKPFQNASRAFGLVSDNAVVYVLMALISAIILIVVSLLAGGISYGVVLLLVGGPANIASHDAGSGMMVAQVVNTLVGAVLEVFTQTIYYCLMGGFFIAFAKHNRGEAIDVGGLFDGFGFFGRFLLVSVIFVTVKTILVMVILVFGIGIGASLGPELLAELAKNDRPSGMTVGFILGIVAAWIFVATIVFALTTFVYPLIALRRFSAVEAIMTSIKSGFANLLPLIAVAVLWFLFSLAGAMACIVGLLFAIPVGLALLFFSFEDVFGQIETPADNVPPPPTAYGSQFGM